MHCVCRESSNSDQESFRTAVISRKQRKSFVKDHTYISIGNIFQYLSNCLYINNSVSIERERDDLFDGKSDEGAGNGGEEDEE